LTTTVADFLEFKNYKSFSIVVVADTVLGSSTTHANDEEVENWD